MESSKEIIKKAGIIPDLCLGTREEGHGVKATGPHTIKLLSDKVVKNTDYETGAEIFVVRYILEEAGEQRKYDVPMKDKKGEIHYLVQRLAEIPEGEEIILEMKKKGIRNYISITRKNQPETIKPSDDDIPVIEDEGEPKSFEEQLNS